MRDAERLWQAIQRDFPNIKPSTDPAWLRSPAVRVIDCVLSLNRRYDGFVVPRLDAFEQRFPNVTTVAQLRRLIESYGTPAEFVADALNYRDADRARILDEVVDYV